MIVIDTKNFQDSDFESESFIKLLNENLPKKLKILEIYRDSDPFDLYPLKPTFSVIFSSLNLTVHFTKIMFSYPDLIEQRLKSIYKSVKSQK